jgi:hypothetical protein
LELTVAVGVSPLLGEVLLPFEGLGWGNHLPIAAGVLLNERCMRALPTIGFFPFDDRSMK